MRQISAALVALAGALLACGPIHAAQTDAARPILRPGESGKAGAPGVNWNEQYKNGASLLKAKDPATGLKLLVEVAEKAPAAEPARLQAAMALMLFHAGEKVRFAEANANLALQNATFAAQSLGLGSFYTGYVVTGARSDRAVRRLINLPDGHRVFAGLALGYPTIAFSHWIDRNPAKIKWI